MLVHGAGSGPWIFDRWRNEFTDFGVVVPDLQEGLDVARATMADYTDKVVTAIQDAARPIGQCGWSMGGLVAAMAADGSTIDALALMEPSPPAEIQGERPDVEIVQGTFDSEVVYGTFPKGIRARAESSLARAERKRGISVPQLPAQTLVIYGDEFADERGRRISAHYGCEAAQFPDLDHWGLVLDNRVARAVAKFFTQTLG